MREIIKETIDNLIDDNNTLENNHGDVDGLLTSLKKNPHFILKGPYMRGDYRIYSSDYRIPYEDYPAWVATYISSAKVVCPTHGYFMPHSCGNALNKVCKKFGVKFDNN